MSLSKLFPVLLAATLLAGCQPNPTAAPASAAATQTHPAPLPAQETAEPSTPEDPRGWWNDVMFYEIFVRSFKDSDGDGIGDFQGIISQLDYLNDGDPLTHTDLGIGGIWLMPIFPSPSYHGYDVTNYQAVNPDYGTLTDFQELLDECHKRGIRVIIDLVINHTSDEHPWFLAAQDPSSGFRDWYVWADARPTKTGPWGQTAWYEANGSYYYAPFWSGMPDLNFTHPMVTKAIENATAFWLDLGVDGFRVDAARYLFEDEFTQQDSQQTITWFQDWRDFYLTEDPETYTVGEVWTDTQVIANYNQPQRGMQTYFMFDLAADILGGLYSPDPSRIMKSYLDTLEYFPDMQFAVFLTNHDQQRAASYFSEKLDRQKLAAFIYLTGPGIPFVYYGEEIGMTGNKPDEKLRTPMQWSAEPEAGFTSGKPWEAINADWPEKNVAAQTEDEDSLLSWYRGLINLRGASAALRTGQYIPFTSSCRRLYTVARVEGEEVVLTVANLGVQVLEGCTISIESSPLVGSYTAQALWGQSGFGEIDFEPGGSLNEFTIAPQLAGGETFIVRLNQK